MGADGSNKAVDRLIYSVLNILDSLIYSVLNILDFIQLFVFDSKIIIILHDIMLFLSY